MKTLNNFPRWILSTLWVYFFDIFSSFLTLFNINIFFDTSTHRYSSVAIAVAPVAVASAVSVAPVAIARLSRPLAIPVATAVTTTVPVAISASKTDAKEASTGKGKGSLPLVDDVGSGSKSDGGSSIGSGLGSKVISLGSLDGGLIDRDDCTIGVGNEAAKGAVVVGVGTIGVGKTNIAIAESTSIAVVGRTSIEEGSIGLSRPLSVPVATAIATATIATKTGCSRTEKASTSNKRESSKKFNLPLVDGVGCGGNISLSGPLSVPVATAIATATIATKTGCSRTEKASTSNKRESSKKFNLPLVDGVGCRGNSLPLAVSVAPVPITTIAVSTAVAIAGLSQSLPLAIAVAPVATIAISTAIAVAGLNGDREGDDYLQRMVELEHS